MEIHKSEERELFYIKSSSDYLLLLDTPNGWELDSGLDCSFAVEAEVIQFALDQGYQRGYWATPRGLENVRDLTFLGIKHRVV